VKINVNKFRDHEDKEGKRNNVKYQYRWKELEQVRMFCYLESVITSDVKCLVEIYKRITTRKDSFYRARQTLNKNLKKSKSQVCYNFTENSAMCIENMVMRRKTTKDKRSSKYGYGSSGWRASAKWKELRLK